MICPLCGQKGNPMGAETCGGCLLDLAAIDHPAPSDRVEASLLNGTVAGLSPRAAVTVPESATLAEVTRAMVEANVGAVLVLDGDGGLVGIVTERDFLTKVAGGAGNETVAGVMTRRPEVTAPGESLAQALGKMAAGGYRHLPVVEGGKPVGMVSIGDFLGHLVAVCPVAPGAG